MKNIKIDYNFLESLLDSLRKMIDYADDGMLDSKNPEFKEFFDDVFEANLIYSQAIELLDKEVK